MTRARAFLWQNAVPVAMIACGVIITICNAFPYVHFVPGGLNQPDGFPGSPATDQASAGDGYASMWQSFFAGGHLGGLFIFIGCLPIILGLIKVLARQRTAMQIALNVVLLLDAAAGLFFTWLTQAIFLNDGGDLATYLPAAIVAMGAYGAILLIILMRALYIISIINNVEKVSIP